ncbi:acidic leucine-rich nuclear phosphoprotein 32 family member C isoform X3 [Oncorhynchus mykiss]|nr:acidic leucine-rich nuclear phosphoprotein 32 family member C isoform X3 [Oncorhynchus mykiss]
MLATLKEEEEEEKEEDAVFGMKEEGDMTVTVKEEEDVFGVKEEDEEEITVTLEEDEEEKTGELINTRERPDSHSDSRKSPSEEPDSETPKPARRHPCSQ